MVKYLALSSLISVTFAGQCPDITEDAWIDMSGPGLDNDVSKASFHHACGDKTTTGIAVDVDSVVDGKFKSAHCRIKCLNWDDDYSKRAYFWALTHEGWRRTKYLKCICNINKKGDEVCHWKRKEGDRLGRSGRVPKNQIQLACDTPSCAHASALPEVVDVIETVHKNNGKQTVCTDCNLNQGRNGVWKCFTKNGEELADGERVPWRGYCKMTCGNPNVPVWKGQIVCQYPHMEDGDVAQYHGNNLAKLYNFMTKNMFMNDENMDGGGYGWQCYA